MIQLRNRKRFVHTLGVAGVGLGLLAGTASLPLALAQEHPSPAIERQFLQHDAGYLDLSDEELRQLLMQLLQEREHGKAGAVVYQGEEDTRDFVLRGDHDELRIAAYHEFTQALADELGIDDADEVDTAIRAAMIANVDANTGLSKSGAEQQKALIADAPAPIGPTYRGHGG
ncbi:MAG: hypothetical protein M3Z20_18930 [Chloroflexota bacterium]|nr:hypothetical protein [Chloroflexota bacterium]